MHNASFEFFALLVAIGAFILALKSFTQAGRLRERLDALEAAAARPAWVPPPLTPLQEFEQTLAPDSPSAAPPPPLAPDIVPVTSEEQVEEPHAAGDDTNPAPPPLPAAAPGFEERIGTRLVVWIGGLALALGGFFLVRYSIEAGLLGPGVRVMLGGLFALALLGAGEWTRRKESISSIPAIPIANIPAILTAAGTAVAFATVYAAYAL